MIGKSINDYKEFLGRNMYTKCFHVYYPYTFNILKLSPLSILLCSPWKTYSHTKVDFTLHGSYLLAMADYLLT